MASRRGAAGRRPDGVRWHRSRLLGRGRRHVPSLKGANGPLSGGRGATARVVLPAARRPAAPQDGSVGRGQEHRDATLGGRAGSAARRARRLAARRARRSQGPGRASAGARDRGHAISCTPWGPSSTSPTIQWRCARSFACSGPEGRPSSGCPTGSIRFSAPLLVHCLNRVGHYGSRMEKSFTPRALRRVLEEGGLPGQRRHRAPVHARRSPDAGSVGAHASSGRSRVSRAPSSGPSGGWRFACRPSVVMGT